MKNTKKIIKVKRRDNKKYQQNIINEKKINK